MRRPRVLSFQLPSRPLFFPGRLGLICAQHGSRACQPGKKKMAMRFHGTLSYVGSSVLRFSFLNVTGWILAPSIGRPATNVYVCMCFLPSDNPRLTVLRGIVGPLPSVKSSGSPGLPANPINTRSSEARDSPAAFLGESVGLLIATTLQITRGLCLVFKEFRGSRKTAIFHTFGSD